MIAEFTLPFVLFFLSFFLTERPTMSSVNTTSAFGKQLGIDIYNTITELDNSTVVFRPKYNTTGLIELKVQFISK
jgi:hypothetical protein